MFSREYTMDCGLICNQTNIRNELTHFMILSNSMEGTTKKEELENNVLEKVVQFLKVGILQFLI